MWTLPLPPGGPPGPRGVRRRSGRLGWALLGFALAVIHAGVTTACIFESFEAAMAALDGGPPPSPGAERAGRIADVLIRPLDSFWTPWMGRNVPNAVENALFLANSALWGYAITFWLWAVTALGRRLLGRAPAP